METLKSIKIAFYALTGLVLLGMLVGMVNPWFGVTFAIINWFVVRLEWVDDGKPWYYITINRKEKE